MTFPPPAGFPPPRMLTPPPPAVWAPRFRALLLRVLTRLDRRKARILAQEGINVADLTWRQQYHDWWFDTGWREGATPPKQAWQALIARRAQERKTQT